MQDVPQLQKCLKSYLYVVSWRAAVSFNLNDKKKIIISYFISSLTNKVSFKKKSYDAFKSLNRWNPN